jgi:hypothetical protein
VLTIAQLDPAVKACDHQGERTFENTKEKNSYSGKVFGLWWITVRNCGNMVGTILAMPLITTATKKYLMLKNCGNTIFYAVDPAVYLGFLWVLDYIS